MKRQNLNLTSPHKDYHHLISSIEGKLQLLANQNFDISQSHYQFASSMPCQLQQNLSPSKPSLQLQDLQSPSNSPVMSRINHIQQQYVSQITNLNNKLSLLQTDQQQLKQQNIRLQNTVFKLQSQLRILQDSNHQILEERLEQLNKSLMHKLRQEIQEQISNYIVQLQQMRRELSLQRNTNKQLKKEKELLTIDRNNFQYLYKELLQKYKQTLQIDIENYQKDSKMHQQNKAFLNEPIKKLKESKKRKSKQEKQQELSKDQLIPFLAKGIQELKHKLKLK